MTHVPETHIEVEGDKPKVGRSRQFFSALRAGLKTSDLPSTENYVLFSNMEEDIRFLIAQLEKVKEQRKIDREEFQLACDQIDQLEAQLEAAEGQRKELSRLLMDAQGAMRSNAEGWAREEARAERLELQRQTHVQMLDDAQKVIEAARDPGLETALDRKAVDGLLKALAAYDDRDW